MNTFSKTTILLIVGAFIAFLSTFDFGDRIAKQIVNFEMPKISVPEAIKLPDVKPAEPEPIIAEKPAEPTKPVIINPAIEQVIREEQPKFWVPWKKAEKPKPKPRALPQKKVVVKKPIRKPPPPVYVERESFLHYKLRFFYGLFNY
jgi:outer membrane biosynthesis protein TonB